MSRWQELMKQPKAKIVTVHNQLDDIDIKGKKFLVSDRVTPSFDSFVTDVNEKLAPPGVALRKIYTAQGGHQVRSVSALTVSKEYTASPKRFDKNRAEKLQSQSKNNSKKNSAASSEGYHTDDGGRGRVNSNSRRLAGHRMTLLERQKLYAKQRSHSEGASPAQSRSVSPAKKNIKTRPLRKPKTPLKRKPISKSPKKSARPLTFNERGKKRLEEKFPDDDSDDSRIPTPPGKRRVAFRGQYIFVTDDDDEEESDGRDLRSKASTPKSRKSNRTVRKSPSKYSARSRISEGDEDEYYSDNEDDFTRSTATKKSTKTSGFGESYNHLTPNRGSSRISTKTNQTKKSSQSRRSSKRQSTVSRKSADSGRNTGSENSDEDYDKSRVFSGKSKQSTRRASALSSKSNDSDEDRAGSRISKYSKYSQLSRRGSKNSESDDEYYDSDYNDSNDRQLAKSRAGTGGSGVSRKSSDYSYQASRQQSVTKSVADSTETKVNTPVDLRPASQVSDSEDYYYSDDEYKKSNLSKRI